MRRWFGCGVVLGAIAINLLSCAARNALPPGARIAAPAGTTEASAAAHGGYLFVPISERDLARQPIEGGRVAALVEGPGLEGGTSREIVEPDGSVSRAPGKGVGGLMGGIPVPKRMGGGFLFWDSGTLYRARTFVAALEPVARLSTNAIGVEFGHDSILLFTPDAFPKAYSLTPAAQIQLSPHGVLDVAAVDDGRGVALDAAGRALASIDGGRTWLDAGPALGARVGGVLDDGADVGFRLKGDQAAWLQKDGTFARRPFSGQVAKPAPRTGLRALERAVLGGLPQSQDRVLVADGPGLAVVDLRTRTLSPEKPVGPAGSTCVPLSLEEEGLAVCLSYTNQGSSSTVVSHALGAAPQTERSFLGTPGFAANESVLVFNARCSGPPVDGIACARTRGGAWAEVDVRPQLGDRQLQFWVVKEGGGVAAIALDADPNAPHVALVDPAQKQAVPWDLTVAELGPTGLRGASGATWRIDRDGTLRGFTSTSALAVDPKGHVSLSAQRFESVSSAKGHALARAGDDGLWQTTDFGAHWSEVDPPPAGFYPEAPRPKRSPFLVDELDQISCSLAGCSIPHRSGAGSWLRIGWPSQPPRPRPPSAATPAASGTATALPAPPELPKPKLPLLRCTPRGALREAPRARQSRANLAFGDLFAITDTVVTYGRRATGHLEAPAGATQGDLASLIRAKARFEMSFLGPFDPAVSAVRVVGSLAKWPLPATSEGYDGNGSARPVLSNEAGHADGVLLVDRALSLWAPRVGAARALRPKCSAESGYVDGHGKLFVACGTHDGATRIDDVETGRSVLQLLAPNLFRDRNRAGMSLFPPGEPVFQNPDAIAVAPDGKLAILRTPSGGEPATVDNPAWLLSEQDAPLELAAWSSLELGTSPACERAGGYRALVQTRKAWVEAQGSTGVDGSPGMSAIVRWSPERVCLEAIEVSFRSAANRSSPMRAIARFVGKNAGATLLEADAKSPQHQAATCELAPVSASSR